MVEGAARCGPAGGLDDHVARLAVGTFDEVRQALAGRAIGAAPWSQAAFVGQELDRADVLRGIAVAPMALVVAVDGMTAGAGF